MYCLRLGNKSTTRFFAKLSTILSFFATILQANLVIERPQGTIFKDGLGVSNIITAVIADKAFELQPVVNTSDSPSNVTCVSVVIQNNPECSPLLGNQTAPLVGGRAAFTDLAIGAPARLVSLRFCLGPCTASVLPSDVVSDFFDVLYGALQLLASPSEAPVNRTFPVQPVVRAARWLRIGPGGWATGQNFTQGVTAYLSPPGSALLGTRTVWPAGGVAAFTDLGVASLAFASTSGLRLLFGSCLVDPAVTRPSDSQCELAPAPDFDSAMAALSEPLAVLTGPPAALRVQQEPAAVYPALPFGAAPAGPAGGALVGAADTATRMAGAGARPSGRSDALDRDAEEAAAAAENMAAKISAAASAAGGDRDGDSDAPDGEEEEEVMLVS